MPTRHIAVQPARPGHVPPKTRRRVDRWKQVRMAGSRRVPFRRRGQDQGEVYLRVVRLAPAPSARAWRLRSRVRRIAGRLATEERVSMDAGTKGANRWPRGG